MATGKKNFGEYLGKAINLALKDEDKKDGGSLKWMLDRAEEGVKKCWTGLRPKKFGSSAEFVG